MAAAGLQANEVRLGTTLAVWGNGRVASPPKAPELPPKQGLNFETSNKCLTSSNKKLVETSATLVVTSALLVVTRS